MSVECFLDTNVLVYAVSTAEEDAAKQRRALQLVQDTDFGISAQVLQELYVTVTRKIRRPLAPDVAMALLEEYRVFPTVWVDYPLVAAAAELSVRYRISYWDAAVLAAATTLGAPVVYSEDLSHGQRFGAVRVVDPFRDLEDTPVRHDAAS